MIGPHELGAAFSARVRQLVEGEELTPDQRAELALQTARARQYLVALTYATTAALDPVAVALVEALVDLGRQLDPSPPAGRARPPQAGSGPAQPPVGTGAYRKGRP